jgi:hypothetical protein
VISVGGFRCNSLFPIPSARSAQKPGASPRPGFEIALGVALFRSLDQTTPGFVVILEELEVVGPLGLRQ